MTAVDVVVLILCTGITSATIMEQRTHHPDRLFLLKGNDVQAKHEVHFQIKGCSNANIWLHQRHRKGQLNQISISQTEIVLLGGTNPKQMNMKSMKSYPGSTLPCTSHFRTYSVRIRRGVIEFTNGCFKPDQPPLVSTDVSFQIESASISSKGIIVWRYGEEICKKENTSSTNKPPIPTATPCPTSQRREGKRCIPDITCTTDTTCRIFSKDMKCCKGRCGHESCAAKSCPAGRRKDGNRCIPIQTCTSDQHCEKHALKMKCCNGLCSHGRCTGATRSNTARQKPCTTGSAAVTSGCHGNAVNTGLQSDPHKHHHDQHDHKSNSGSDKSEDSFRNTSSSGQEFEGNRPEGNGTKTTDGGNMNSSSSNFTDKDLYLEGLKNISKALGSDGVKDIPSTLTIPFFLVVSMITPLMY